MSTDQPPSQDSIDTANKLAKPYGYVNEQGQIWQNDFPLLKGKMVGQVFEGREEQIFTKLTTRFQELQRYYIELVEESRDIENKPRFLTKVYELLEFIPEADALGDFTDLLSNLHKLKDEVEAELQENFRVKSEICDQIAAWAQTDDWKVASEEVKELQQQFKESGPVTEVQTEDIWKKFRSASDKFYETRKKAFEEQDRIRHENLKIKEEMCTKAEELSLSDNWKQAAEDLKELQVEWKAVGPVPRDKGDAIWFRFKEANDAFFNRRQEYFNQKEQDRIDNLWKKEEMCEEVEKLAALKSFDSARERVIELQKEWKTIGPVPKGKDDELWQRFRTACDNYFKRA